MISDMSKEQSDQTAEKVGLQLPDFPDCLESAMSRGKSFHVDGTNVIRVPFGIRQPQKKRPQRPERLATLVLPFQPLGSPTPPPQAA